jgi:hypothetical protein
LHQATSATDSGVQRGTFVKRTITSVVVVLAVLVLAIPGCKGRENAGAAGESTETIAPATPQPEATGTEAMTQTVEVGTEGRSLSEGGVLSDGETTAAGDTAGTTATDTTATAPPPTTTTR